MNVNHGFGGYRKRFGKTHPDWLSGEERKPGHVPYRPYVNLCENDSPGMCTCADCRAWDASGRSRS